MDDLDEFSQRLRDLKEQHRLTTAQLADRTRIPKRTLDKYLAKDSTTQPGVDSVRAICRAFGTSADWLLGLDAVWSPEIHEMEATERAAQLVIEQFIAMLISINRHTEKDSPIELFENDRLMGATAGDLAADCAYRILKLRSELMDDNAAKDAVVRTLREGESAIKLDPDWQPSSPEPKG